MRDLVTRLKISETLKRKGIKPPSRLGCKIKQEQKETRRSRWQNDNPMKNPLLVAKVQAKKKLTYDLRGRKCNERDLIESSKAYKDWRISVFKRDGYTCRHCFQIGGNLQADHIKPFSLFPELRLDISNGRTLCRDCHKKTPTFGSKLFQHKKTLAWG